MFSGVPSKEGSGHLEVFEAVSVCSSFPMAGLENRSKGGLRGGPWGLILVKERIFACQDGYCCFPILSGGDLTIFRYPRHIWGLVGGLERGGRGVGSYPCGGKGQ